MFVVSGARIIVLGLLLCLGAFTQPAYSAQVTAKNNSSKLVDIAYDTNRWLPIIGSYTHRHDFSVAPGKGYRFDDVVYPFSGSVAVFIRGHRASCYRQPDGHQYYFLSITVEDAPGDKIKCNFSFR